MIQESSIPNPEDISDLVFFTNRAILGEIRPNMRCIFVEYVKETQTLTLYICYDKPLTQEELDYDVVGTIICEMISDFPQGGIIWKEKVVVVPYPERIPDRGICVFSRYEPPPHGED